MRNAHLSASAGAHAVTPLSIRGFRKERRENQRRFWGHLGVTQSRGSHFDLGAEMPASVAILV